MLCRLAQNNGVKLDVRPGDDTLIFNGEEEVPPPEVLEWAGLKSSNAKFQYDNEEEGEDALTNLNDIGRTFSEIADLIEQHMESL